MDASEPSPHLRFVDGKLQQLRYIIGSTPYSIGPSRAVWQEVDGQGAKVSTGTCNDEYADMISDVPGETIQAKLRLLLMCYEMNCTGQMTYGDA